AWGHAEGEQSEIDIDETVQSRLGSQRLEEFKDLADSLRVLADLGEAERRLCISMMNELTRYLRSRPENV
ncbi:MAG: hypothetical protein PVI04_09420, partial [Anaerolineales bacterium]